MELAAGAGRWLGWLVGAGAAADAEADLPVYDDAALAPYNGTGSPGKLYVALDGASSCTTSRDAPRMQPCV